MQKFPWRLALLAIPGAAYVWLDHLGSISKHPPALSLVSGFLPLLVIAVLLAWSSRARWLWLVLLGLVCVLVGSQIDFLRSNLVWLFFCQHAGMHALLGITFGRTLFDGHERALCSRIAGFAHGGLTPALARYTWRVTLTWTLYFWGMATLSVLLFAFAPLTVWSVLANLLTPPLIGLIFVLEYLVRRKVLPDDHHIGILDTIRAYRRYSSQKADQHP